MSKSQNKIRYWDELDGLVGVEPVGTDFGHCCQIVPQIALSPTEELAGLKDGDDGVRPGSQTGETNGLAVLLDVENYNIGYYKIDTQGLKVAVHDHKLDHLAAQKNQKN